MTDALHDAFLEDHRHLMRGLAAIRDALRAGRVGAAADAAASLDSQVGPHMEFEERVFYPTLEPLLGRGYIEQLYREHAVGQAAIVELRALGPNPSLTESEREALAARLDATLEHAASCGTLLSHLEGIDARRREELLAELRALRGKPVKWTDLPRRPRGGAATPT